MSSNILTFNFCLVGRMVNARKMYLESKKRRQHAAIYLQKCKFILSVRKKDCPSYLINGLVITVDRFLFKFSFLIKLSKFFTLLFFLLQLYPFTMLFTFSPV